MLAYDSGESPIFLDREMRTPFLEFGGFADGRSVTSPDSEKIERPATKLQKRNFSNVEQIQDESPILHHKNHDDKGRRGFYFAEWNSHSVCFS